MVFTTSGAGSYAMEDVDAITGESKIEDVSAVAEKILTRLNPIIK